MSNNLQKRKNKNDKNAKIKDVTNPQTGAVNSKFEVIHSRNIDKAKMLAQVCDSSSDEEELNDDKILSSVFKNYVEDGNQLEKFKSFLDNFFQSGFAICLICIGTVKRVDAIWSCKNCYCFFHLTCIKRWGNDSISTQKIRSQQEQGYYRNDGTYVPESRKPIIWCCPKCRYDYKPDEVPKLYTCFCAKELNPPHHPWLIPHSCGEVCEKYLVPECGHKCLLLCHPGPCAPCPQNVMTSCKCGRSNEKLTRCFQKSWTCEAKCQRILKCGIHKCEQLCHEEGRCAPCSKKSNQPCECGQKMMSRNCSDLKWKCSKICNRKFSCGLHKCQVVCHAGDCGECPMGLPRTCPCGKKTSQAPCNEEIDSCGDTCQKFLLCNTHVCAQRCHRGECGACLIIVEKKCRCGQHSKELPCSKSFTCEMKCKQMKDCKKHVCNKKCCDGQCPPCDKICAKTLSCRKHKCKSVCHDGPCYPCELKSQVKCRCGFNSLTVPCGREKKIRAPKCNELCRLPVKCHHKNPHKCHWNDCPPCNQQCNLPNDTSQCGHVCQSKCHDAVKVFITEKTSTWDYQQDAYELKKLPHPRCEIKIPIECIGGHETVLLPCWNAKTSSCGRICGRSLSCGNHVCERECHSVPDVREKLAQAGCQQCNQGCKIARNSGCIHPCQKQCHKPPCEPCVAVLKVNCHCGLTQLFYKCSEYYKENMEEPQEKLKCCGNRCIKNYTCGHRCSSLCHSGSCPDSEKCRKKIKIYCDCKNLKSEISCDKYRNGSTSIPCNETCVLKKENQERMDREEAERLRKIEEERNRLELEQFEKKFGKRKYREKKSVETISTDNRNIKKWLIFGCLITVIIAVVVMFILK